MPIRAVRLCHQCCAPLCEDDAEHYVFECHACVIIEYDLAAAVRRDPDHLDAERLSGGAVHTGPREGVRARVETRPARRAA